MISLTELAKTKISEISDSEGIGHKNIRMKILGGGCLGYNIDLNFEESILETDIIFKIDDIILVIDQLSINYIDNLLIDFKDDPFDSGFSFTGNSIKNTCGCKKSFEF